MKRLFFLLGVLVGAAIVASRLKKWLFPYESLGEPARAVEPELVYTTASGQKYHRKDCLYLQGTMSPVPLEEALVTHEPCTVCNPPRLTVHA